MTRSLAIAAALLLTANAHAERITVPVDIGIAPAVHLITGPVQDDQILHYGLKLSLAAVIDKKTIQANKHRVPARYRSRLKNVTELRFSPAWYLPDTLFISPRTNNTGLYGVAFRPIGIGLSPVARPVRINASAGLLLTYLFIHSDTLLPDGPMHFIRPGIDLKLDIELPLSRSFLLSVGWASQFYIPQEIGKPVFEVESVSNSIWHIGQAYLMFHFRFPYTVSL